jgi:competence protein ComGF
MVVLKRNLKASTLVETIVAMVIIMICSGIGLDLFSNLSHDVNDELRIEAEIRINSYAVETKLKNDITESVIESSDMRIQRSFQDYRNMNHIKVMLIDAYSLSGKKICGYRELVRIN